MGKHAMPVPEKSEGPVGRDANALRALKHRRACCRGSMRCPCPKKSYGRFAGTQTTFVLANTAGPAVGDACDALARKDRSANLQGRNRLVSTQTLPCLLSGKHAMS